jgi:hypothetical protein
VIFGINPGHDFVQKDWRKQYVAEVPGGVKGIIAGKGFALSASKDLHHIAVFYFDGTEFSYFDQCSMISCAMGTPTR